MLDQPDKMHDASSSADGRTVEEKISQATAGLSDYVRHGADYARELADKLQSQKADELMASALTWTRKQPLLVVGGAVVLGFVLSRIVKGGMSGAAHDESDDRAVAPAVEASEN
ncbi:MAG: hypothetical protein U1E60_11730 [Reyranellaceae bacterium]